MSHFPSGGRYLPYGPRTVAYPTAARPSQIRTTGGPSAEGILPRIHFRPSTHPHNHRPITRGNTTNQHPNPYPSTGLHSTQALCHHHMHVQPGVGQTFVYEGARRGTSGAQPSPNHHHGAHPGNPMPVDPPHSGAPRSLYPGYTTPMANRPDIPRQSLANSSFRVVQNPHQGHQGITGWHQMTQSLDALVLQSAGRSQVVVPPQQSPPKQDLPNLPTATTQWSQPASAEVVLSFGDSSSTNPPSVREEAESKEAVLATEICPFPGCNLKKKCGRSQELERHIYERHLPPYLYCGQPGCDLTSSRPYLLNFHHDDKHPEVPMPKQDAFMIYDAKGLAKQVRNKEIGIEQAVNEASSIFKKKAKEMGKLGTWRWMKPEGF